MFSRLRAATRSDVWFFALWAFTIFVSVFDGYLVLTNRTHIGEFELNPMGRSLLRLNGGDIWLLLAAKGAGTVVACSVVLLLYWKSARLGLWIAGVLAALQLLLLLFLLLG